MCIAALHEKKRHFLCSLCPYKCGQIGDLNKHIAPVHEKKKPSECSLCQYKCGSKGNLNRHITLQKKFFTKRTKRLEGYSKSVNLLKSHGDWHFLNRQKRGVHEKKKPFECSLCQYKCVQIGDLNKHIFLLYMKRKSPLCSLCPYIYKSGQKNNLTKHIAAVREKKKPFVCSMCLSIFSENRHLKRHIAVHEKKNLFECSLLD